MLSLLIFTAVFASAQADPSIKKIEDFEGLPQRIAFGSCSRSFKRQPVLNTIADKTPDLFVYLGDNIYADTRLQCIMRAKYRQLARKPEFKRLRATTPIVSTWDDHDYSGGNDAGAESRFKTKSEQIFLDFWEVPEESDRRKHPGVYGHYRFEADGRSLSLILLDTRYFRGPLKKNTRKDIKGPNAQFRRKYQPDPDPEKTVLGKEQWAWLEERLREPADVRIIGTSIQFAHAYNGLESWNNFPLEKARLLSLIKKTQASGVIFISGDVHWGEISREPEGAGYPIYDVTSSGLTQVHDWSSSNKKRVGKSLKEVHFGIIEIDWSQENPEISLQLIDVEGTVRREHTLLLDDLKAK